MEHYLISYDLHKERNYKRIEEGIAKISNGGFTKPLATVFIIKSSLPIRIIRDTLLAYVDLDDSVFVMELSLFSKWEGFNIPSEVAKWINES